MSISRYFIDPKGAAKKREIRSWNERVDREKEKRAVANRRAFMPRKASHKQGWKRPAFQPY